MRAFTAVISALFRLLFGADPVENLRAAVPDDLTYAQAAIHLKSALNAERVTGEPAAQLLAISWHETRFTSNYVQPESPDPVTGEARNSCGVLTPEPLVGPCRSASLDAQYIDGARHLAMWRGKYGDRALDAFAGGNWLATGCAVGPMVRNGRDLCAFRRDMLALADKITHG